MQRCSQQNLSTAGCNINQLTNTGSTSVGEEHPEGCIQSIPLCNQLFTFKRGLARAINYEFNTICTFTILHQPFSCMITRKFMIPAIIIQTIRKNDLQEGSWNCMELHSLPRSTWPIHDNSAGFLRS